MSEQEMRQSSVFGDSEMMMGQQKNSRQQEEVKRG
jgi:hypothetical protein